MNNSGSFTHKPRAVDPTTFRAAATGIGQTLRASIEEGTERGMCVAAKTPAASRAATPAAEGFQTTAAMCAPTLVITPTRVDGSTPGGAQDFADSGY